MLLTCLGAAGLTAAASGAWFMLRADADLTSLFYNKFASNKKLKSKIVWITGASSGIGEHLAYELAKIPCRLVLSARRESELERVKQHCLTLGICDPNDILVLPFDMTDLKAHKGAVEEAVRHFKAVDVLVNNAGRSQRCRGLDMPAELEKELFDLNYFSLIHLTKLVVPYMQRQGGGTILLVSSVAGKIGSPLGTTYTATKHALQGYFSALRPELYRDNIRVQFVCPGPVASQIQRQALTRTGKPANVLVESSNIMSTSRCASLMATNIAHCINETWICNQPLMTMFYINQYVPTLAYSATGLKVFTKRLDALEKILMDGKHKWE